MQETVSKSEGDISAAGISHKNLLGNFQGNHWKPEIRDLPNEVSITPFKRTRYVKSLYGMLPNTNLLLELYYNYTVAMKDHLILWKVRLL